MSFIKYGEVVNKDGYTLKHTFSVQTNDSTEIRIVYYNYVDCVARNVRSYDCYNNEISTSVLYYGGNISRLSSFEDTTSDKITDISAEWVEYDSIVNNVGGSNFVDENYPYVNFLTTPKSQAFNSFYYDFVPFEYRVLNPIDTNNAYIGYDIIETENEYIYAFYKSPIDSATEAMCISITQMPQNGYNLLVKLIHSTILKIKQDNTVTYLPYVEYESFNINPDSADYNGDYDLSILFHYPFDIEIGPSYNYGVNIKSSNYISAEYIDDFEIYTGAYINVTDDYVPAIFGHHSCYIEISISADVWDYGDDEYIQRSETFIVDSDNTHHTENTRASVHYSFYGGIDFTFTFYGEEYGYNYIFGDYFYDYEMFSLYNLTVKIRNVRSK